MSFALHVQHRIGRRGTAIRVCSTTTRGPWSPLHDSVSAGEGTGPSNFARARGLRASPHWGYHRGSELVEPVGGGAGAIDWGWCGGVIGGLGDRRPAPAVPRHGCDAGDFVGNLDFRLLFRSQVAPRFTRQVRRALAGLGCDDPRWRAEQGSMLRGPEAPLERGRSSPGGGAARLPLGGELPIIVEPKAKDVDLGRARTARRRGPGPSNVRPPLEKARDVSLTLHSSPQRNCLMTATRSVGSSPADTGAARPLVRRLPEARA